MSASHRTVTHDKRVDFPGLIDAKGRRIGAHVFVWQDSKGLHVRVHATRNGETFGALPKSKRVVTGLQANAEIKRRVNAMIKRYVKKAQSIAPLTWTDSETSARMGLYDADDKDAGKYEVVCEQHSTCIGVNTLREGRSLSTLDFCEDCMSAHSKEQP